eukprot:TRINITY_DN4810_c0_g1_i4.p1 TRINITY_DN4810_c0_g1~~TRINITY_DN4810_c0_g1_i4.p1  ORF type:complete len:144 (+),score=13.59 TRINITY_DN4810_c0_g1_i4:63-494(+)
MTEEDFESNKSSLISTKLVADKNLKTEAARYKVEIEKPREYNFKRAQLDAKEIESITKQELIEFYDTHIMSNNHRKKMSSRFYTVEHYETSTAETDSANVITEFAFKSFQNAHSLYSLPYDRFDLEETQLRYIRPLVDKKEHR